MAKGWCELSGLLNIFFSANSSARNETAANQTQSFANNSTG